jgi:hypothetical protein
MAVLAVGAAVAIAVIASRGAGGGDGESQVQGPSPTPLPTEARPVAPANTAPPENCATPTMEPAEEEEEPTLFDTLADGAATDDPNFEVEFSVETAEDAARAKADLSFEMLVRPRNVAAEAFSILVPSEWSVTPGCQIPIGLEVGSLRWDARVGLDGNPCNQPGPLRFLMLNATTDTSNTVSFLDADNNGEPDFAEDKDRTGRRDVIERYPDFLNRIFPERTPMRRTAGVFTLTDPPVLAQTLAFESLDGSDGTTLVVILQNI